MNNRNGMTKLTGSGVLPEGMEQFVNVIEDPVAFVKTASDYEGLFDFQSLLPDDDHVGIHLTAIGDSERYGFNRNADGFTKKANETYHPTFVKYGMVYRHHKNKDRNKNLGHIKASAYNPYQGRIELYIHAHKGRAEKELTKFAETGEIPYSMACRVQEDRCSICDTKRKTSKDPNQCDHVRHELGKLAEDGRYTGTYNDEPKHFDISFVIRPADRIAWSLSKAASDNGDFVTSDALAEMEGVWTPEELLLTSQSSMSKLAMAKRIADFERKYVSLAESGPKDSNDKWLWELRKAAAVRTFDDRTIEKLREYEPNDVFFALADSKIVMDPVSYVKYAMGVDGGSLSDHLDEIEKEAQAIFMKMAADGTIYESCLESRYDVDPEKAFGIRGDLTDMVKAASITSSMELTAASRRAVEVTLSGKPVGLSGPEALEKAAGAVANVVAREYATYKLASAYAMQMLDGNVEDGQVALLAAQNMVKR